MTRAEGSLMAKLNVRGNEMMEQMSKGPGFPIQKKWFAGSIVCIRTRCQGLETLIKGNWKWSTGSSDLKQGKNSGRWSRIFPMRYAALRAHGRNRLCPFNKYRYGGECQREWRVEFHFDTEVTDLRPVEDGWEIRTSKGTYKTRYVVNAAGVYADKFHNMVSNKKIHITPRRGDYCLLGIKLPEIM